jgi:predicted dehydrogenase
MNENKRIGMIGAGWIAEKAHLPVFISTPGLELTGLYDPDKKRAASLSARFGINRHYDQLEDLLQSDVDAVIIATPNNTHYAVILKALEYDKHVLCEKPVVLTAAEMQHVMANAQARQKIVMPAFVNRFRSDIMMLKTLMDSGKMGDILSIEASWLRKDGIPRPGTWITGKDTAGGGVLIDLGSHIIDICLMAIGEKKPVTLESSLFFNPEKATALSADWLSYDCAAGSTTDVEDSMCGTVQFDNNVLLTLQLSWATNITADCTFFHIKGTRGFLNLKTLFGFSNNRLYKKNRLISNFSEPEIFDPVNMQFSAFRAMANHFAACLHQRQSPLITADDGLRTVSLIEQLYTNANVYQN